MLHYFFINPTAGSVKEDKFKEIIEKTCKDKNFDYKIAVSEYKGHIPELVRKACEENEDIYVYSIGGDGTIYEAVNGIMNSSNQNAVLIPVPCGSGNDFIRTFGYSAGEPFEKVLERVMNPSLREIDAVKVNDKYGANITSVGFDANVVANSMKFRKSKLIPNKMTYTFSVFYTFVTQGSYAVTMYADGEILPYDKILLTAAANGQYYGGGMQPVPSAEIDDGLLDMLVVEKVSKLTIPRFFPKYQKGLAKEVKQAHLLKCRQFVIESEKEIPLNIDGEVSMTKRAVIEISERKLKIGILALDGNE